MRHRRSISASALLAVLVTAWCLVATQIVPAAADTLPTDADKLVAVTGSGEYAFTIEIADEETERAQGLMFRETMPTDHGMLFDFGRTEIVTMWMRNTPMSLDMVFIRSDGTIARIAERTTPYSDDTISSEEPVAYVLELRAGVTRLIGLKPGDRLRHRLFDG